MKTTNETQQKLNTMTVIIMVMLDNSNDSMALQQQL
jgi:hypothetical protein